MSVRIAFFLSLLILPLQADTNALKTYILTDANETSSEIKLADQYEHGFVLKSLPGSSRFTATLRASLEDKDGVFVSPVLFGAYSCQDGDSSADGDVLRAKIQILAVNLCSNDTRLGWKKLAPHPYGPGEVSVSYARRDGSDGHFEATVTAFTAAPCTSRQFQCGTATCIWAALRCDGRDNCGDGSDERGCDLVSTLEYGQPPSYEPQTFPYGVALGVVVAVCLICVAMRWREIFTGCCKTHTD